MSILLAVGGGWDEAPWLARFRDLLPGDELFTPATLRDPSAVSEAIVWKHPAGLLLRLPNLQGIFSLGAGVDHVFADPELPDKPIVRVVDPDLRDRMSEWVVMHALLHLRAQKYYDDNQSRRLWREIEDQPPARETRVGIMGLGVLGLDAARKLRTLGFEVAGWARSLRSDVGFPTYSGNEGLAEMAARTDILICLLPLTPQTRGLLSKSLFAKLARDGRLGGPVLINAGRGGLQVEADVDAALRSGVLKAASLDVFETEPLPEKSPLWNAPNLYISPHNSAISTPRSTAAFVAQAIQGHRRGEVSVGLVDRSRGY